MNNEVSYEEVVKEYAPSSILTWSANDDFFWLKEQVLTFIDSNDSWFTCDQLAGIFDIETEKVVTIIKELFAANLVRGNLFSSAARDMRDTNKYFKDIRVASKLIL